MIILATFNKMKMNAKRGMQMNVDYPMTTEQLYTILINAYNRSEECESIEVVDFINELKQQLMAVMTTLDRNINGTI